MTNGVKKECYYCGSRTILCKKNDTLIAVCDVCGKKSYHCGGDNKEYLFKQTATYPRKYL